MELQDQPIVNRVANSGLVTLNLEEYYHPGERVLYDLKENLYQGMILREKDFREFVKAHDWEQYRGKNVAITCTEDAIVPVWAYMLLVTKLEGIAHHVALGSLMELEKSLFQRTLAEKLDVDEYQGAKIVIKGCGDLPIPEFAYTELTRLVKPVAQTIMYGEPCSTVPLYKKPKPTN